ncbi:MAG: hypothetical protein GY765_14385 [bacterium]|nr:hypothetical protein [bacterium]
MRNLVISLIACVLFIIPASSLSGAIPPSERAALIAFYNSVEGSWSYGWKVPPLEADGFSQIGTEGTWNAVGASDEHVVHLGYILQWEMSGPLPAELGDLPYLNSIFFVQEDFTGPIPPELGNCTALTEIELTATNLTGAIPPELGNLSNLTYLRLAYNNLTSIPPALGNLSNLESLLLEYNNFTEFPDELGNLGNLKILALSDNNITTINPQIANATNLTGLHLRGNRISTIPTQLAALVNMTRLDISRNNISVIPLELAAMTLIETVNLSGNQLTFEVPESALSLFPGLNNLTILDIGYNGLYTTSETVRSYLNGLDRDWESTQTVAPSDLSAIALSNTSVRVSWTPIAYTGDTGGYRVYYSRSSGGPWENAGITSDKSVSNYTVNSLSADTLYYFTVSTRTDAHRNNPNAVVSSIGPEVWADTAYPVTFYTITVQSSPETGLTVAVSPDDDNGSGAGVTNFTRTYLSGTSVTLTAPVPAAGMLFSGWTLDGTPSADTSLYVSMTGNHTAVAAYEAITYTLNVNSTPDTGASITVSPNDTNGAGGGNTNFTRSYNSGTPVTLTAPASFNQKSFCKWTVEGTEYTEVTVQVTMNGTRTATVTYEDPQSNNYILTVQSTPEAGVGITVSPDDVNSTGNGNTNFTRSYADGTPVTLTAPTTFAGNAFSGWTLDGASSSNATLRIAMNGDHTAIAIYEVAQPVNYTLQVQSATDTGVPVTVTPNDNSANGNGNTNFSRTYIEDTRVTLTAPSNFNGKDFSQWALDGTVYTDEVLTVTLNGNRTAVVSYTTPAPPEIGLNRSSLNFASSPAAQSGAESVLIENTGGGTLNWTAAFSESWLGVSPANGTGIGTITLQLETTGLSAGTYTGTLTVSATEASNSPQTVAVTLNVHTSTTAPIGSFDTPLEASTVSGSIAVTGWALDDIGIDTIKIYRQSGASRAFIGDAIKVEGARTDLESRYPDYPANYNAGWGYMLLTNSLSDGPVTLSVECTDVESNTTLLGTRTISIANAGAVKPFGAIDSPAQGGTASGSNYQNWGWVLTPQPNSIPIDGSTISVYVDGVLLGSPIYNLPREDIAALFPGYVNSNDAGGYFTLDTTPYANGIHAIAWVVTDNAGNSDGIGSRYFSIMNTESSRTASANSGQAFSSKKLEHAKTVAKGERKIRNTRPERVEIRLAEEMQSVTDKPALKYTGGMKVGDHFRRLPVGSSLDAETGVFSWIPGPGFLGTYHLVFLAEDSDGQTIRKDMTITIVPGLSRR